MKHTFIGSDKKIRQLDTTDYPKIILTKKRAIHDDEKILNCDNKIFIYSKEKNFIWKFSDKLAPEYANELMGFTQIVSFNNNLWNVAPLLLYSIGDTITYRKIDMEYLDYVSLDGEKDPPINENEGRILKKMKIVKKTGINGGAFLGFKIIEDRFTFSFYEKDDTLCLCFPNTKHEYLALVYLNTDFQVKKSIAIPTSNPDIKYSQVMLNSRGDALIIVCKPDSKILKSFFWIYQEKDVCEKDIELNFVVKKLNCFIEEDIVYICSDDDFVALTLDFFFDE